MQHVHRRKGKISRIPRGCKISTLKGKKERGEDDQISSFITHKEADIVNFIKIQRIKCAVKMSEWTETASLKKVFSMPDQLTDKADQIQY
ncbi:hypothetical protein TNCV_4584211 [Trichonephila clavipes]|nr:hypothetical protein TNCV_4584211 [Trichonephila clavipes]